METTTVKLSVETRDRIRDLGGATYEDTIVEAIELLEQQRFWTQAEAAAAWRASRDEATSQRRAEAESAIDAAFDGIE